MTPEQRIAQLAAARGATPTYPRPAPPARDQEPATPTKRMGFDIVLPGSWQGAEWGRARRLRHLEAWLAAGVIARYLGPSWHRELAEHETIHLIHREGYGFKFAHEYGQDNRFRSSPIHTWSQEPKSITTSAARPIGAIARDIENRLLPGLVDAWGKCQENRHDNSREIRERFDLIHQVIRAFGGKLRPRHRWYISGHPEAELPQGTAQINYRGRVELSLNVHPDQLARLGAALGSPTR